MSSVSGDSDNRDIDENDQQWGRELESRTITIEAKRIYLDLKENKGGRVLKISEVVVGGQKSRVFIAMDVMPTLVEQLKKFAEFAESLKDGTDGKRQISGGLWKSESFFDETRQYYLDLKENARGIFCRLSQISRSRGGSRNDNRQHIVIPNSGLKTFANNLENLLLEHGGEHVKTLSEDGKQNLLSASDLPKAKTLRASNKKMFFFDPSVNTRGAYIRLTELHPVTGNRSSITVPLDSLKQFKEVLDEMCKEVPAREVIPVVPGNNGDGDH
uniref:DNA-binding protein n=1 Tax=Steinernema glaseri TaxID=37863 RepID=A0A1I7YRU9_9BILA